MSAIASFFLVRKEDVAGLQRLATQPVGPDSRGKWRDPFHDFLFANAQELEPYDWSGYVIGSEVYFYLHSRSITLDDYCDRDLSQFLSQARGSSIFIFQADAGGRLAQAIERHWPDEASLTSFLHSPDMTVSTGEVVPLEAVFDGLRILKSWLAQVEESKVGLLTIG